MIDEPPQNPGMGSVGSRGPLGNDSGSSTVYSVVYCNRPGGRGGCEETHVIRSPSLAEASSCPLRSNYI